MTKIIQSVAAGAAVVLTLATSASAAPLFNQGNSVVQPSLTENVRLVCNEDGRCYRTRGPRYVERRYYGDSYAYGPRAYVDPGYGYGGPSYYGGPGYYGGGPSIGFSFGTVFAGNYPTDNLALQMAPPRGRSFKSRHFFSMDLSIQAIPTSNSSNADVAGS